MNTPQGLYRMGSALLDTGVGRHGGSTPRRLCRSIREGSTPAMLTPSVPTTGQVIAFPSLRAVRMTPSLFERAKEAACVLPPGHFSLSLEAQAGDDEADSADFVRVTELRGNLFGDFAVSVERGRFCLCKLDDGGTPDRGLFLTLRAAFLAIVQDIERTWAERCGRPAATFPWHETATPAR